MGVQNWLFKVALGKALKRGAQFGVSWLAAQGLESYGVKIDEVVLTGSIFSLLEIARNFLKIKFGWKFL